MIQSDKKFRPQYILFMRNPLQGLKKKKNRLTKAKEITP